MFFYLFVSLVGVQNILSFLVEVSLNRDMMVGLQLNWRAYVKCGNKGVGRRASTRCFFS